MLAEEEATACDSVPDAVCMPPSRPLTTGGLDCLAKRTLESEVDKLGSPQRDVSEVSWTVAWDAEVDHEDVVA